MYKGPAGSQANKSEIRDRLRAGGRRSCAGLNSATSEVKRFPKVSEVCFLRETFGFLKKKASAILVGFPMLLIPLRDLQLIAFLMRDVSVWTPPN